jgi:hypothetical protein
MWCFSVKDDRIASVKDLNGLSDQEAIEKAKLFFEARIYDTFEVWDGKRMVYQHTSPNQRSETTVAVWLETRGTINAGAR